MICGGYRRHCCWRRDEGIKRKWSLRLLVLMVARPEFLTLVKLEPKLLLSVLVVLNGLFVMLFEPSIPYKFEMMNCFITGMMHIIQNGNNKLSTFGVTVIVP